MKITKRSVFAFLIAFILMFISASVSYAQENGEEEAKKLGITFPIAELGNCSNLSACKAYCDLEANKDACVSFAKKKGIKTDNPGPKDSKILDSAKSELGCDSENSCRAICEQEANRDKCASFAQKHGLGGSRGDGPGDKNVLNKAKEILGCDSEASCRSVCENPANQEKCSNFAKATGLGGGIRRVGPGGCNSEASCKAYCETHQEECGIPDSGRRGPGGCNSEASCRAYCEANPQECGGQGGSAPREAEDKFCRENPEKCAEGRGGPRNSGDQRPDRSGSNRGPDDFGRPPEGSERRGPSGSEPYVMPPEGFDQQRFEQSYPEESRGEYPTPSYQTPSSEPVNYSTPPQEVRGISTGAGLLQQVFNQLLTLF